jgi:hypothetical protein
MATMITEVYDAFKAAGVDDEKARKAAEAIATYENKFHEMKTEFQVIKWMVGTNIVLTLGVLGKLLR